jgi:hypothetical protein
MPAITEGPKKAFVVSVVKYHGTRDSRTDHYNGARVSERPWHVCFTRKSHRICCRYQLVYGYQFIRRCRSLVILVHAIAGVVHRVNKLVSVLPVKARYSGQIGDVVIGRILDVGQKRWRVDINANQVHERTSLTCCCFSLSIAAYLLACYYSIFRMRF